MQYPAFPTSGPAMSSPPMTSSFWPTVIDPSDRTGRPYDLPSRLLQERIRPLPASHPRQRIKHRATQ